MSENHEREIQIEKEIGKELKHVEQLVEELAELKEEDQHAKKHQVVIVVHNEDSGRTLHLEGRPDDSVQHFITLLYKELRVDRKPTDRLRCEGNGQDVFQYAHLNVERYLHEHCDCRTWLFASATGGAWC
jgi:hypothetical protein